MSKRKRTQPTPEAEPVDLSESPQSPGPSIFNTTFSIYRVSPLYIGASPLDASRLKILSKRLRETLVGDVVRGVHIGLSEENLNSHVGALKDVVWRWVGARGLMKRRGGHAGREGSAELGASDGDSDRDSDEEGEDDGVKKEALVIELRYETTTCTAILLPRLAPTETTGQGQNQNQQWTSFPTTGIRQTTANFQANPDSFTHLPLLLLRMPAPLKSIIADFISRTFDCRISSLRLGTRTLVACLEDYLKRLSQASQSKSGKDVNLTLGFDIEKTSRSSQADGKRNEEGGGAAATEPALQPGLRTMDVYIPAPEILRFIRAHSSNSRSKPARPPQTQTSHPPRSIPATEEGWHWRNSPETSTKDAPFTEAVAQYLDHHLALDLFHPSVRILRVACDGFVAGGGRVKVFEQMGNEVDAVRGLLGRLVDRASGGGFA
ncbi:kinetochore complex Sim4 subunit Fta1-domain-containing protein [Pseudomassariella vexata]|uniref:Kinetochore complex Sim4 subunit Fta1-domain-containing protein n=1 Tax=Pseudomassariella vexata TaxID=1141098 RepID=A0A1Y2EFY5_9PEZI|nr:kinetochore complex Sim4 subunit Fta1-domain-containing protein [Pseudomassariella vexata]ORY70481.1 kinetochore complex Sim4 subunit Fta1-domain-containing protein [Pseudomassariella vexata]